MTQSKKILLEHEGPVSRVVLNRPEKLNALDREMIEQLVEVCHEIELRSATRVVTLTGTGGRAFCAGGDIADWSGYEAPEFGRHWVRRGHMAFDALARLRQPVIAVLNGHVLGGGLELAACADLRIGERHIRIGQPEAGIGIIPGWSGTQRAVRRFGSQAVRRMALFGEMLDAEEGLRLGIVDTLADSGKGMEVATGLIGQLNNRSAFATEMVKLLLNAAEGEELESTIEAFAGIAAAGSADLKEGIAAFNEKRKPEFGSGDG